MLCAVFGVLGAWFAMMGVPSCLLLLMISAVNPCHWVNPLAILLIQNGGYTILPACHSLMPQAHESEGCGFWRVEVEGGFVVDTEWRVSISLRSCLPPYYTAGGG